MTAHAKFSASGSERWLGCPGSINLSKNAPPPRESEYAKEGTQAHECLEKYLTGKKVEGYPAEMVAHAKAAAAEIWRRQEWRHRPLSADNATPMVTESRVSLEFVRPGMFGTVDAALIEEFGTLTVIDYKYGAGIAVSPENNSQLIYYALGLAHQYDYNFSRVTLVVIQPRAADGNAVKEWSLSVDELISWRARFAAGVDAALAADAPLNPDPSGKWCRFCPAAAICPALTTKALAQAKAEFGVAGEDSIRLPKPGALDAESIGAALHAVDKLETWAKAIRAEALARLRSGGKVPGFKLVESRATRKWVDAEKTEKEARKAFGENAFITELLSPAQLEKVAGKEWVNSRASAVSSGTTLAPETDGRKAVDSILADFGNPETVNLETSKVSKGQKSK